MPFGIGAVVLFVDNELDEIFEVVVEGVTLMDKPNTHGFCYVVRNVNGPESWQVSPDELEALPTKMQSDLGGDLAM